MRSLILAAVAAFTFAAAASAATNTYTKDANGHCHNAQGHEVASSLCTPHRDVVCTADSKPCGPTCIPKNQVCRRR